MKTITSILILSTLPTLLLAQGPTKTQRMSESDAALARRAKVSEPDARKMAQAKVPGGTVKDYEIEEENGLLVWSYDFTQPGTPNITEVQINAMTGKIAAMEVETPKDIAKEVKVDAEEAAKAAEAKAAKAKK